MKLMKNCPLCYDLSWNNDNDNCLVQHKLVWYKLSRTAYFNQSMAQYGIMGHWISFPFLCHGNDNGAVVCNTEQRQYKESLEACWDGFCLILRRFYGLS